MRIYSPSQTMKFIENPVSRELYKEGWQTRYLNRGKMSAILGTGVHAGIAQHYRKSPPEECMQVAHDTAKHELDGLFRLGAMVNTREAELAATLPLKAKTVVRRFIEEDPIRDMGWDHLEPELQLPDYGWCKIDLPVFPYAGQIAPLDWKIKLRLDPRYEWRDIEGYAYSWQMMHYAWAFGEHFKKPVKEYYVCWIALEPKFRVKMLDPYFVNAEQMQLWLQSARTVWALMAAMDGDTEDLAALIEAGPLPPYHTFNWFNRYGREEYASAFLDHRFHRDLMKQDYINTKQGG